MAKTKWRDATVYVGTSDPASTKLLNKRDVTFDGPKQIRDETTIDDDVHPTHGVIMAGVIDGISFPIIVDAADGGYQILQTAAEQGTEIFFEIHPRGDGSGKRARKGKATVDLKPLSNSDQFARETVSLMPTGTITHANQP
jgi:hypothetical protein